MTSDAFEGAPVPSVQSLSTQLTSQFSTHNTVNNPTPDTTSDAQQITVFADDADVTKASVLNARRDPEQLIDTMVEITPNEIADVLSRPYVVLRSKWAPEDVAAIFNPVVADTAQFRWKINFPQALFNINDVFAKLERYACFRADVCMRIMVNGSPFQAGKLWCYFAPYADGVDQSRFYMQQHLSGLTGFPGGELDVSTGNAVELRIPYSSPYPFIDLINNKGSIGDLNIAILNKITMASADLTVMAWFENVRLQVPTAASLGVSKASRIQHLESELTRLRESNIVAQGPVSDISGGVSTVANALADVPLIGTIAKPLGWIANLVHNVSSALGFSKPLEMTQPTLVCNLPAAGFTNLDVPDNSVALSVSHRPGVGPSEGLFATDADEMDIGYLTKKSCMLLRVGWDKTDAVGTKLLTLACTPTAAHQETVEGSTMIYPTTLCFVSQMFRYWRGGLRYRISLAKTVFHTGRIRFVFIPYGLTNVDYSNEFGTYSWVLDLRTGSELEFTIPYVHHTPYLLTGNLKYDSGADVGKVGLLCAYVMNELQCPDTVAPHVEINVWVSGAEDFELGLPTFTIAAPAQINVAPVPPPRIVAQVLGDATEALVHDEQGQGDVGRIFKSSTDDLICSMSCLGEKVTNLRPLTRRFGLVGALSEGTTYKFTPTGFGSIPRAEDVDKSTWDPTGYISCLYRFCRGGMRHKLVAESNNSHLRAALVDITSTTHIPFTSVSDALDWNPGCPTHYQNSRFNNILEFETPQLSDNPSQLIGAVSAQVHKPVVHVSCSSGDASVLRATADDFTFAWLIGAPICKKL